MDAALKLRNNDYYIEISLEFRTVRDFSNLLQFDDRYCRDECWLAIDDQVRNMVT